MKIIKLLIWCLIILILILVAVFGVDTSGLNSVKNTDSEEEQEISSSTDSQEEEDDVTSSTLYVVPIPTLSQEEWAQLPDFIKAMPKNPTQGDYDGNWLRDDIEVFIAYTFPFDPYKRAAYIQLAKILDRIATDSGQTQDSRQITLWRDEQTALECFFKNGFTDDNLTELKHFIFNSSHKIEGYQLVVERRATLEQELVDSIVIPEQFCDFVIIENEISLQDWKAD